MTGVLRGISPRDPRRQAHFAKQNPAANATCCASDIIPSPKGANEEAPRLINTTKKEPQGNGSTFPCDSFYLF